MALFAVHLLDGFLPPAWCAVGYVLAIALAALACRRLSDREIPTIALVTAAYFVASSIHIKVGVSSVHLVFNGLVGVLLVGRAPLSIFVGLFLQALLIGHGGLTTLGVNVVLQAVPALIAGRVFRLAAGRIGRGVLAVVGGLLSGATVLATVVLQSVCVWAASEGTPTSALVWFAIHLPVAAIETVVVGFALQFLGRVKPELIGLPRVEAPATEDASSHIPV